MTCRSDPPAPSSGSSGIASIITTCALSQSEILVLDEIGLPFRNAPVIIHLTGRAPINTTTDANGKVCFTLPPGTAGEVELVNVHESAVGDSTSTASGRHFALNGIGP